MPDEPSHPSASGTTRSAHLLRPRTEVEAFLQERIKIGKEIRHRKIKHNDEVQTLDRDHKSWEKDNQVFLGQSFSDSPMLHSHSDGEHVRGRFDVFRKAYDPVGEIQASIEREVEDLQTLVDNLIYYELPPMDRTHKNVFVVHGRDNELRDAFKEFVKRLGLRAIVLAEQPGMGLTIIEKFEYHAAKVGYAVVLLTPDDIGKLDGSADDEQKRARQNVLFELGYFVGKLGRRRVCLVRRGLPELPSDLAGVEYLSFDSDGGWQQKIAREMKAAGLEIDFSNAFGG